MVVSKHSHLKDSQSCGPDPVSSARTKSFLTEKIWRSGCSYRSVSLGIAGFGRNAPTSSADPGRYQEMCTCKSNPEEFDDLPGLGNMLWPTPHPKDGRTKPRAAECSFAALWWHSQARKPGHWSQVWAHWAPGPDRGHISECLNSSWAMGSL